MRFVLSFLLLTAALRPNLSAQSLDALLLSTLKGQRPAALSEISIQGKSYWSVLAKVNPAFSAQQAQEAGILVGAQAGGVISLKIPVGKTDLLLDLPGINLAVAAPKAQPSLERARKDTRSPARKRRCNWNYRLGV